MGQYYGGYYLRTAEKEDWNKIKEAEIETESGFVKDFFDCLKSNGPDKDGLSSSYGMDLCLKEDEMDEVEHILAKILGYSNFMFVGVTSNINVDPYTYLVYNFYNVKNDNKYLDDSAYNGAYCEMWEDDTLFDIDEWIEKYKGLLRFGKNQKEYLLENYGLEIK